MAANDNALKTPSNDKMTSRFELNCFARCLNVKRLQMRALDLP